MPWSFDIKNPDEDSFDEYERAGFANIIARMLVEKEGSVDAALKKWQPFYLGLEAHVRNIYELSCDIPMNALYELENGNWKDLDFENDEHFELAKKKVHAWCEMYYVK